MRIQIYKMRTRVTQVICLAALMTTFFASAAEVTLDSLLRAMTTPFTNQVRVDQLMTQGNNVLTRTRNLDGVRFPQSLDFNFELISWKPTKLIYATTTYWYAFSNATSNIQSQPDAAKLPAPILAGAQKQSSQLK